MVVIKSDTDLDEDVYDEIVNKIDDSNELDRFSDFVQEVHDEYNLSESLTAQFVCERISSLFSEEDQ